MSRWQRWMSWWDVREPRERWLLGAMCACLLAFFYWYALVAPLRKLRDEALAGHRQAATALVVAEARLQAMQELQQRQALRPSPAELPALLAASAARAGIDLTVPVPEADGSVVIRVEPASTGSVLAWLDGLRREHALGPEQAGLDPAEGGIAVQLVFRVDP